MIAALPLIAQLALAADPAQIAREVQAALDRDGGHTLERRWRDELARSPRDPRALLRVATFERNRYRYETADSLTLVLEGLPGIGPEWIAAAQLGRAAWRALGSDVAAADSLYSSARRLAAGLRARRLEADATLGLLQIRQRTLGPQAGLALVEDWWRIVSSPSPADSAVWHCTSGVLRDLTGDTTGYHRIVTGAGLAERASSWRISGNCHLSLAQLQERRGYIGMAWSAASRALRDFRRIDYALGIALAGQWFGYIRLRDGGFADARALLDEAVVAARRTRFESVEAWANVGLADLYLQLGDLGRARRYASLATESHQRRGDLWGLATSRGFEARVLEAVGDLAGAQQRFGESQRAFVGARIPANAGPALISRASVMVRLGLTDSAERVVDEGRVLLRSSPAWRGNEELQLRALLALRRGRLAEAESLYASTALAKEWRAGSPSRSAVITALREAQVALRRGRMALADSALATVLARMAEWRAYRSSAGYTASFAQLRVNWSGMGEVYPDVVAQLTARDRVATAFEFVERIRARDVAERRLQSLALERDTTAVLRALRSDRAQTAVVTLRELRQSIGSTEAFVTYVFGVDDAPTTAIVVTRDTVHTARLARRDALLPDITRLLQLASTGNDAATVGRRLGAALLDPVLEVLPASITRVTISPDGELHRVPFDALRLADGRFAIERATISIAPSATTLLALRASAASGSQRVVAIGDPRYLTPEVAPATSVDRTGFTNTRLQRLPWSGDEARRVAAYGRPGDLLLGARATESAAIRALTRPAAVLHLAVHGIVDDQSQFTTAVALAAGEGNDGFLTPAELSRLSLHGALVVLSACRSAAGQVLAGEGLRGLTAPLLEAGARVVVGTYWSIGDRSVVPFVDRFYAAMAEGLRVDDALRRTKLQAIRDGASIADWASFSITGDGSVQPSLRTATRTGPMQWLRNVTQGSRDTSSTR